MVTGSKDLSWSLVTQVLEQGVPKEMAAYDAAWHAQGMPKTVKPWLLKA